MVTIIKHGSAKTHKHTCRSCGAVFTYNDVDKSRSYNPIFNSHSDWEYEDWITCPECGDKSLCQDD